MRIFILTKYIATQAHHKNPNNIESNCQVIALSWTFYKLLDRFALTYQVIALNWPFNKLLDQFTVGVIYSSLYSDSIHHLTYRQRTTPSTILYIWLIDDYWCPIRAVRRNKHARKERSRYLIMATSILCLPSHHRKQIKAK